MVFKPLWGGGVRKDPVVATEDVFSQGPGGSIVRGAGDRVLPLTPWEKKKSRASETRGKEGLIIKKKRGEREPKSKTRREREEERD